MNDNAQNGGQAECVWHLSKGAGPSEAMVMKRECMEQERRCSQGVSRSQLTLPCLALQSAVHVTSVTLRRSHIGLGALAALFQALHTKGTVCNLHRIIVVGKVSVWHCWYRDCQPLHRRAVRSHSSSLEQEGKEMTGFRKVILDNC